MNDNIREILESFPPNFAIDSLVVRGATVETSNFISLQGDVALFTDGAKLRAFSVEDIDVINF